MTNTGGSGGEMDAAASPKGLIRWWRRRARPAADIRWGLLQRLTPVSEQFGFDRGQPVDRYYIETFLAAHAADVRGRVLEIGDNVYTRKYGGDRVVVSDVLHVRPGHPGASFDG